MASKNFIFKRKIANEIYELLPKTSGEQVEVTYGSVVQSLASALSSIYTDIDAWNTFKKDVDFAGKDSALDTLREMIDYLSAEDVATSIAGQLSDLKERLTQAETNLSTLSETVTNNKTAVDASIESLTSRVSANETAIQQNTTDIDELRELTAKHSRIIVAEEVPEDITDSDLMLQIITE